MPWEECLRGRPRRDFAHLRRLVLRFVRPKGALYVWVNFGFVDQDLRDVYAGFICIQIILQNLLSALGNGGTAGCYDREHVCLADDLADSAFSATFLMVFS